MAELLKPDFETVFEVYYDRVYKYAYTILLNRENAEDVVEETFLAAYVAYPGYDPARSSLATWLTRIAHNKAVNLVRSAAYRRETAMPAMQAAAAARHSAPAAGPAPRAAAAATPPTKGSDAITMSKSSFTPPIIKNLKLFEGVKRHIKVKIIFFVGPNILISEKRD